MQQLLLSDSFPDNSSLSCYKLRNYQVEMLKKIHFFLGQSRKVMVQSPTGSGKTVTFSYLAKDYLEQGKRITIVAHRAELIYQTAEKIKSICGVEPGLVIPQEKPNYDSPIQIAMKDTAKNRLKHLQPADLIIVDEAHHSICKSYESIINHSENSHLVGFSATPVRNDGQGFQNLYDEIVIGPSVRELIDLGMLTKFRTFVSANPIKVKEARKNRQKKSDYTAAELNKASEKIVCGDIVAEWQKHANNKQTVVFCHNIATCEKIAKAYADEDIKVAYITQHTTAGDRKQIVQDFAGKKIQVLVNCMVFTEGFDSPGVECIQMLRPTASLSLWIQMVGRGLRPAEGKEYCLILDHTDNTLRLGFPDDPVEWSLEAVSLPEKSAFALKHDCGHFFKPLPHEQKPVRILQTIPENNSFQAEHQCVCPACQETMIFKQWHCIEKIDSFSSPQELVFLKNMALQEITEIMAKKEEEKRQEQQRIALWEKRKTELDKLIKSTIDKIFHREVEVFRNRPFSVWYKFKENEIIRENINEISREHVEYLRKKIYCEITKKPKEGWLFYAMKEIKQMRTIPHVDDYLENDWEF